MIIAVYKCAYETLNKDCGCDFIFNIKRYLFLMTSLTMFTFKKCIKIENGSIAYIWLNSSGKGLN